MMRFMNWVPCAMCAGVVIANSLVTATTVQAADIVWDVADGDWFTATNWDPQTVPTASDDAVVSIGTTRISSGSAEASELLLSTVSPVGPAQVIIDGGSLTTGSAMLHSTSSSNPSSILVDGTSSLWTNNGNISFDLGEAFEKIHITVSNGGTINSDIIRANSLYSDQGPWGTIHPMTVTGLGSSINTVNQMQVSNLMIQDQGVVTNDRMLVASSDNTKGVLINGGGSNLDTTGKLDITWGTMRVENGGSATAGSMAVGGANNPDVFYQGHLYVDGTNSTIQVTNALEIGDTGGGSFVGGGRGSMTISNGGQVNSGSGRVAGGTFGMERPKFFALIDGPTSSWTLTDDLLVRGRLRMHNNGQVSVGGDYLQNSNSGLDVQLVDLLQDGIGVTGNASLDGELNILIDHGLVPQIGDTFDILTTLNGTVSGVFDSLVLDIEPGLAAYQGEVIYHSNSVQFRITDVPEPTTLAILSILGVGAVVRRR